MSRFIFNLTQTLFLAAFCILFVTTQGWAQSQANTGQITGVVKDSADAVVPNATVTLINKNTNADQTANTTDEGIYRFVLLQPGSYSVKATAAGFGEQTLEVEVQVGRTVDGNFTLGAAGTTAEVTVTAESIQTTASQSDAVQNETAINNLPINGRRFQDFVGLTPTAQTDPSRGQISLSGQRGINTNVNVDGVDFNQPFFGGIRGGERSNSAFTIPQESIREFQVVAAGYSAEFGRSSGGIVNAVTKSGTNQLRGSAFYLLRPEQLARGNDFTQALQNQRLNGITVNGVTGVDALLAPTQQQFGGSIGGPILEDKLFYFGSYEQQRFRAPLQVLFTNLVGVTPTAPQTQVFDYYRSLEVPFDQSNDAYAGLAKVDYQVNDNNRANVRFNYSRNRALNAVSTGQTVFDPTRTQALGTNGTEKNRNIAGVGQLISNFGSSMINELRVQYAREDRPRLANEFEPNVATNLGTFGTTNFLPTTQYDTRAQITDSLTYLAGNHSFKFGGEYSRIFATQFFAQGQTGEYVLTGQTTANTLQFLSNNRAATGFPNFLGRFDSTAAIYRGQVGNGEADIKVQELAFFAQDSWRINSRLTLNYGLRVEEQFNPSPDTSNTALVSLVQNANFPLRGRGFDPTQIQDSGLQIAPRLGFAFDPVGDGKTVIRGFAGLYQARTPLLLFADAVNNYRATPGNVRASIGSGFTFNQAAFNTFLTTPAGQAYRTITGCNPSGTAQQIAFCTPNTIYRQFAVIGIDLNSVGLNNLPTLTPGQIQTIATTLNPTFNPNIIAGIQVTGLEEDYKNPESVQFGFAFEREFMRGFTAGVDFSQVKTSFLQRNVDANLPTAINLFDYIRANNSAAVVAALDPALFAANRPYIGITRGALIPATVLVNGVATPVNVPTRARPLPQLGSVQIRSTSASSMFRSLTFRARFDRKWGQLNAFYTLSKNESDDDNERDAGGVLYTNPYDLSREYGASRLDRRHQFVANPVFFLPYGFEASSAIRLRSGNPINTTVNADLNGDGLNNDRPFSAPGVEFERNAFRNKAVYDVDLRVQKGFNFDERKRLTFSAEFFNVLNRSNIQIGSIGTTQFCAPTTLRCGLDGSTNVNFLQLYDGNPTSTSFGLLNISNNPGSQVFQVQLGARFAF